MAGWTQEGAASADVSLKDAFRPAHPRTYRPNPGTTRVRARLFAGRVTPDDRHADRGSWRRHWLPRHVAQGGGARLRNRHRAEPERDWVRADAPRDPPGHMHQPARRGPPLRRPRPDELSGRSARRGCHEPD